MTRGELSETIADALDRAGIARIPRGRILLLAGCAVAIVVLCGIRWWPAGGSEFEVVTTSSELVPSQEGTSMPAASAEASTPAALLYVHVVGAVRRPGVVCIPVGSRIADSVEAAGGLLPNAEPRGINLARLAQDGEQLVVPTFDEWQLAQSTGGTVPSSGAGISTAEPEGSPRVNLNTADAAALDSLPGVGPSTAAKIIADRESNGPFAAPEDLMRVSGIGAKKFEALKEYLSVQ